MRTTVTSPAPATRLLSTDLIFPFFLFIVGVSITPSRRSGDWRAIVRRTVIIFALGLLLNLTSPDCSWIRWVSSPSA